MNISNRWIESEQYRSSRRSYIKKPLTNEDSNRLQNIISEINKESNLNFQFVENCSKLFNGFSASYGMISGLTSCIALVGSNKIEGLKTKAGYYGEMLVLEATSMSLGTCWIGGTYKKEECKKHINLKSDEELVCVIAVGYTSENRSLKDKFLLKATKSRKSFDEILLKNDAKLPNWVDSGINSVMKAPSAKNKQPIGYSFENNNVKAYIAHDNQGYEYIDLGISMLHFQLGAKSKGHEGEWKIINNENIFV